MQFIKFSVLRFFYEIIMNQKLWELNTARLIYKDKMTKNDLKEMTKWYEMFWKNYL